MEILNLHQRKQAKQRFWIGYLVTILLVGTAIYQSTRLPSEEKNIQNNEMARMQQRDAWWAEVGAAAHALNDIRDLELSTPGGFPSLSAADRKKVTIWEDYFEKTARKIEASCYVDTLNYKYVLQVVDGLRGFHAQIKTARRDLSAQVDQGLEGMKTDYEMQIKDLEQQLREKDQQIQMLMLMNKPASGGGGGGGGGGAPQNSALGQAGGAQPVPANCKKIEQERELLTQKLIDARGKAMDIVSLADQIENATNQIKRDKSEKQVIYNKLNTIRTHADGIRKL